MAAAFPASGPPSQATLPSQTASQSQETLPFQATPLAIAPQAAGPQAAGPAPAGAPWPAQAVDAAHDDKERDLLAQPHGEAMHIVAAGEAGGVPMLWVAQAGGTSGLPLAGAFGLRFSGPRVCTGMWQDGRRVPCPRGQLVGDQAQCLSCSGLEHPECVFEPLCQGVASACLCAQSFQGVEHLVYCAFYGTLPKVGMTQARRVGRRLREQGADLYFVVARGMERGEARRLEQAVSYLHRIPEFRSHRETLPQLARPVDWEAVEARAAHWAERLSQHHPVEPALHRIADHPLAQPLPGRPRRVAPHGLHRGTWLGGKGDHLFYAQAPAAGRLDLGKAPVAAIKRSDLVGNFVTLEQAG